MHGYEPVPRNGAKHGGGPRHRWREFAGAATVCCLSLAYFYRSLWTSRGDSMPGDLGDARLCMVLMEHWWAVCRGLVSWRDPNFLAPTHGILGYSHTLFLHALIYIPFRIAHLDTYLSFAFTIVVLRALGFVFCYWFGRETLELSVPVSLLCACLFTIANINTITSNHAQLLNFAFVPLQAVLIGRYFRRGSVMPLAGAACLTGAMLFTDVYEVFFGALMVIALTPLWLAAEYLTNRSGLAERLRNWLGHAPRDLAIAVPFFLVWLWPILEVYWPVFRRTGGFDYAQVLQYTRDWREILNVGPDNVLWGSTLGAWYARAFPQTGEPGTGISPLMAIAAAAATAVAFLQLFTSRSFPACGQKWHKRAILLVGLAAAALYLVSVRVGGDSLWRYLRSYIPGARGIRVTGRVNTLLVLDAILVCGLAIEWLLASTNRRWVRFAVLLFAAGLCAEQINRMGISGFSRSSELTYFARFPPPPPDCARFYVFDPRQPELSYIGQMDAMVLARRIDLPTINGYSGENPAGFDMFYFNPGYPNLVAHYLIANRIWSGTCALDLQRARWYNSSQSQALLQPSFPDGANAGIDFKAGGNAKPFEGPGWSSPEPIGTWTDGPEAILALTGFTPARGVLTMRAVADGFCAPGHPQVGVTVFVNDDQVAAWTLTAADKNDERVAQAPPDALASPVTVIRFHIWDPASPRELGLSPDTRSLGMLVKQITLAQNR